MNKKLKSIIGLGLSIVVVGCSNGELINAETAKQRSDDIITFHTINGQRIFSIGYETTMTIKQTINKSNIEAKIHYYYDAKNNIERVKIDTNSKSPFSSSTLSFDMYMGSIQDGEWNTFYYVENKTKTYSDNSIGVFYNIIGEISTYKKPIESILSSQAMLLEAVNWEDTSNYIFKSKGDGHLYLENEDSLNKQSGDARIESSSKEILEFENNLLKSYSANVSESETLDGVTNQISIDTKLDIKWGCELAMPNIAKYEKVN